MPQPTIVVFDTDCALCSGMVHFILKRERAPSTQFVGAWSEAGLALAEAHGFSRDDLQETFLVIEDGHAFSRSDAALCLARHLKAPWAWGSVLRVLPAFMRDPAYTLIARNRYRLFGRTDQCFVPPADARARFIDA